MIDAFPKAKPLLGDRGYNADWFPAALIARGITPGISPSANRAVQIDYEKTLYRQRHKIENTFGRIKDWRCVHTLYNRHTHTFMSVIAIDPTVLFWR